MSAKGRISKTVGVERCAQLLSSGRGRKEIVEEFTKAYKLSVGAVDKWIKSAREIIAKRKEAAEAIRARVDAEQTEAVAKKLGITREWLLSTFKRIADQDVRKLYHEDGTMKKLSELDEETARAISSIEVTEVRTADGTMGINKKIKGDPRITAAVEIGKLMGYYPQQALKAKLEEEDGKGNKKSWSVTLNLG